MMLACLERCARDIECRDSLLQFDAAVRCSVTDGSGACLMDFRRDGSDSLPREGPIVEVAVDSAFLDSLWLGGAHEVMLLLEGRFSMAGPTPCCLTLLKCLGSLSAAYAQQRGVDRPDPRRFQVLSRVGGRVWQSGLNVQGKKLTKGTTDQVWLAAAVLAALPGACLQLELPVLLQARRDRRVSAESFEMLVETLWGLALESHERDLPIALQSKGFDSAIARASTQVELGELVSTLRGVCSVAGASVERRGWMERLGIGGDRVSASCATSGFLGR